MVGRNLLDHPLADCWEILAPSSQDLDLMDGASVRAFIERYSPDLVIHAAGKVGGIQANLSDPIPFLDRNMMMGRNVIMAARNSGVRRLINLGSTCIYPRAAENPLRENQILTGELEPTNEGYAIAKITALRLCEYIRRVDPRFLYKTIIPCNLYGPHDKFDSQNAHIVPAVIRKVHDALKAGKGIVEIWGDGTARREFMYAADLAEAIFLAAKDLETLPDLMNLGVGEDHSINDYYTTVANVIGWSGRFTHDLSKPVGMQRKLSDTSRQVAWGWSPKTSLETGVKKAYSYYLKGSNS